MLFLRYFIHILTTKEQSEEVLNRIELFEYQYCIYARKLMEQLSFFNNIKTPHSSAVQEYCYMQMQKLLKRFRYTHYVLVKS